MSAVKGTAPNFIPLDRNAVNAPRDGAAAAKAAADGRDPKMMKAAKSFETQFIRQMISEMRKTVPKDELLGDSMADDIYRGQLDDQYADLWANQGGIGLADLIYQQLQERYGPQTATPPAPGEFMKVPGHSVPARTSRAPAEKIHDLLARADQDLFLAKKTPEGILMKSREPLPEPVGLRSPLSGLVLQAAALPDGRQMVVVRHDEGLVTQLVHTGYNRVKTNMRVKAGEVLAELPASQNGEGARVFFGLRKAAKVE